MKNHSAIFILFFPFIMIYSQTNTEIYIFDYENIDNKITLSNPINISDNEGYDSQPYFLPNSEEILFSSNRNKQTDLVKYFLKTHQKEWILNTSASEYSPTLTPDKKSISYIKLEENGTQLLWFFNLETQKESILIPDLKIGYHVWFDENTIVSFVLGEPHTLQITKLDSQKHQIIDSAIGRSLHKIPNKNLISYVSKKNEKWSIQALNPKDGTIEIITEIPFQTEDLTWTPEGNLLVSYHDSIYLYDFNKSKTWQEIIALKAFNLSGITRLTISQNGKKIALVVQGK